MWMLSFLPDDILHFAILAIMFAGLTLYVLGLFVRFIPPMIPYKTPIEIAGTLLFVAGVYFYGSYDTEMRWREKVKEAEAKVEHAQELSTKANTALEVERKKKQKVITEYAVTIKERIIEKEKLIDAECKVTPEAISILNDAAKLPGEKK